jgi:transcriptional regulator with XRE-family HTH domain
LDLIDMVISIKKLSPTDLAREMGAALMALRLQRNLTREQLGHQAGVPVSTLRRFETTGLAPVLTVARLAVALGCEDGLRGLFRGEDGLPETLDDLLDAEAKPVRQRASGRRRASS